MAGTLDFWFDFASTYSYLSAIRIDALASERGVHVRWRPFLLGPIFKSQGWQTSPFNIYPSKGRYMVRDIERIATRRGIPFRLPEPFPQQSLKAARIALSISDEPRRRAFCKAIFELEFQDGADISTDEVIARCLSFASVTNDEVHGAGIADEVKARLRSETDEAIRLGIFGAPSFVTSDGELFWGDDRLEPALEHASRVAATA